MTEINRFYSLDNFRLAWLRVRNSSRAEVKDRLGLRLYSPDPDNFLQRLIERLLEGSYQPQFPNRINSPKPNGTSRSLTFLNFADRIIYQAVGNIIADNVRESLLPLQGNPVFAPALTEAGNAYMLTSIKSLNKYPGNYRAFLEAVHKYGQSNPNHWMIETDITAFYPSIDHLLLRKVVVQTEALTDVYLVDLLMNCLSIWSPLDTHLPLAKGIPVGYETSDLLSTLFLFDIDRQMSETNAMFRFVDDIVLFGPTENSAKLVLRTLDRLIQGRGLSLHSSKTNIVQYTKLLQLRSTAISHLRILDSLDKAFRYNDNRVQQNQTRLNTRLLKLAKLPDELGEEGQARQPVYADEDESELAFILYRMKGQSDIAKALALRWLSEKPHRITPVVRYLIRNYLNDKKVIARFVEQLENPENHPYVRAQCLLLIDATKRLKKQVVKIAFEWLKPLNEWYLRIVAISILEQYPEAQAEIEAMLPKELDNYIKAAMILACAKLNGKTISKVLGQLGTEQDDFLRDVRYQVETNQRLIESAEQPTPPPQSVTHVNEASLRATVYSILGVELSPDLPIARFFPNIRSLESGLELIYQNRQDLLEFGKNAKYLSTCIKQMMPQNQLHPTTIRFLQEIEDYISELGPVVNQTTGILSFPVGYIPDYAKVQRLYLNFRRGLVISFRELHTANGIEVPTDIMRNSKPQFFFSHSGKDDSVVTITYDAMTNEGHICWVDHKCISPGEEWPDKVEQVLESSEIMILFWSLASKTSGNVKPEIQRFLKRRKKIIPILLDACELISWLDILKPIKFIPDQNEGLLQLLAIIADE